MLVMDTTIAKKTTAEHNAEYEAKRAESKRQIEELKKSAPPSLTFTAAEFDAYSDKLLNIVDE